MHVFSKCLHFLFAGILPQVFRSQIYDIDALPPRVHIPLPSPSPLASSLQHTLQRVLLSLQLLLTASACVRPRAITCTIIPGQELGRLLLQPRRERMDLVARICNSRARAGFLRTQLVSKPARTQQDLALEKKTQTESPVMGVHWQCHRLSQVCAVLSIARTARGHQKDLRVGSGDGRAEG